jgi:TolB-like protein/DNA-binding winged helix-turn-helix (wHTH) protein/Flp pilus assembly protein TadD
MVIDSPGMEPMLQGSGRVRFGVFEVDLRAGELRKRGLRVRLQHQPFQVLEMLLRRPREVVSRDELRNTLWKADTFVDFDHGLNKAINKIRDALGDSSESPRFIETVARRGYRFIGDVQFLEITPSDPPEALGLRVPATGTSEQIALAPNPAARKRMIRPFAWKVLALALALTVAFLVGRTIYARTRSAVVSVQNPIRSLAVLPLENLSGKTSEDYFADGMTDELITDLAQISALRVISRTSVMSYKAARKPLPQIARELNVDAIMEGTVLRSGNRVRITTQLIQAATDKHLWAQSYESDLSDTLALQNKLANAIAEQIRIKLSPQEETVLKSVKVVNPDAYESYLKGRYFWNKRTAGALERAIEYFNNALKIDPNYAPAYAGLADCYALLGDWEYGILEPKEAFSNAKAAATKAIELDDGLSEAHTSLAFCLDAFDWDWNGAEREFKRAIALAPGYATAHQWYAWHLMTLGRDKEAIAEMRKAQDLDPLSLIISADMADTLLISHRYPEATNQSRRIIDMDPGFALGHYELGQAFAQRHLFKEAVNEFKTAIRLSGGNTACSSNLANAYAVSGRRKEAVELLEHLKDGLDGHSATASEIALIYAGLGENDEAIVWLEKAYSERFNPSVLLRPVFDPLRSEPQFKNLLRRIGLPA